MGAISRLLLAGLLTLTTLALEVPTIRTFSYVGGEYADDGTGTGEHIFRNQLYVEKLEPFNHTSPQQYPVVLIHGQAQTGTNFLDKPDGGRGWASNFVAAGYTVYIVDQTFRGRSPWQPGAGAASPTVYSAEYIQRRFTAGRLYNLWPQAQLQTQWPGNGTIGDPIFDSFYSANVQFILNATYQQSTVQSAGAALLDAIGPATLIGHSQGGPLPLVIADARPNLIRSLILLEPSGPPFQEAVFSFGSARAYGLADIPLNYQPPLSSPADLVRQVYPPPVANSDNSTVPCILQAESPAPRQLPNLADKRILVVTGEASYHAPYDYCTVEYLRQAGASKTEFLELGKAGIRGNGHLLFLERNSDEIWARVEGFIRAG
ncbi:Alpha/beta hydrolase-like protein 6 [Elsinoe fawcettii]|nr:Alpha/beta hydrolase-like protein 6 [Elsinoe fawcettii]